MALSAQPTSYISVYPNPTTHSVTVSSIGLIHTQATITDVNGRLLQVINIGQNNTVINMSGYATGVYFLKLASNEVIKVIKK